MAYRLKGSLRPCKRRSELIKILSKYMKTGNKRGKTRANTFGFTSVRENGASFFNQLQSEVKQNESNRDILATLSWKPLYVEWEL